MEEQEIQEEVRTQFIRKLIAVRRSSQPKIALPRHSYEHLGIEKGTGDYMKVIVDLSEPKLIKIRPLTIREARFLDMYGDIDSSFEDLETEEARKAQDELWLEHVEFMKETPGIPHRGREFTEADREVAKKAKFENKLERAKQDLRKLPSTFYFSDLLERGYSKSKASRFINFALKVGLLREWSQEIRTDGKKGKKRRKFKIMNDTFGT